MNFLSPLFLWVLPVTLFPILLHLLRRKTPQKILFSHIQWITQVHKNVMPRRRLHHLLLLIIRTLFILCLILFFARPVLQSTGFLPHSTESSSIVFLIDVSASMGQISAGQTALQRAVAQMQWLSRKLPAHVRLGWITFSDHVEDKLPLTLERAAFNASLEKLIVKWRPTNIAPALDEAFQLFSSVTDRQKKILIVSDGARHGWQSLLLEKQTRTSAATPLSLLMWNAVLPSDNKGGIVDAVIAETKNGFLKGTWSFHNPMLSAMAHRWSLELKGKTVSQGQVEVNKEKKTSGSVQVQWPEGGLFSGAFHLTPDDVPYDDVYYVAGQTSKRFSLVIVDGEVGSSPTESETYYLRTALESPRDPHLESILVVRPEALTDQVLAQTSVLVLANTNRMDDKKTLLMTWLEKGGGLFLSAGSNWMEGESPLTISDSHHLVKNPEKIKVSSSDGFLKKDETNNFDWDQIHVNQHVQWIPTADMVTLVSLANGDPLLIQKPVGKGTLMALSTTLDRDWSNLPGKPMFAPLVRQIIMTLSDPAHQQQQLNAYAGEPLKIKLTNGVRAEQVISPDGSRKAVMMNLDGTATVASVDQLGIYFLKTNNPLEDQVIAVNIRNLEAEGDLTLLKESEFTSLFPGLQTSYVKAGEKSSERMLSVLEGKDLTNLFLILTLLLFLAETLILVFL